MNSRHYFHTTHRTTHHPAFTLVELLITIAILSILALMLVGVMRYATEESQASRSQAIVDKVAAQLQYQWAGYEARQLPVRINPANAPAGVGAVEYYRFQRDTLMQELQRCEFPETRAEVFLDPVGQPIPTKLRYYRRIAAKHPGWTDQHEGAECLLLILSSGNRDASIGLSSLSHTEIGDTDNDGMPEILDGFGVPLVFFRQDGQLYIGSAGPDGDPLTLHDNIVAKRMR